MTPTAETCEHCAWRSTEADCRTLATAGKRALLSEKKERGALQPQRQRHPADSNFGLRLCPFACRPLHLVTPKA